VHARIARELALKIAREGRVEFKEEKLRIGRHSPRDLAGVDAFAGPVFGNDAGPAEIHFPGHFFHERLGTRDNGSDLKRTLQESLKEQGAHRKVGILGCGFGLVQS
jgi:hypothetical protein